MHTTLDTRQKYNQHSIDLNILTFFEVHTSYAGMKCLYSVQIPNKTKLGKYVKVK